MHRPAYCNFAAGDVYAVSPTVNQGRMIPIKLFRGVLVPALSSLSFIPLYMPSLFPEVTTQIRLTYFGSAVRSPSAENDILQPPDTIPVL